MRINFKNKRMGHPVSEETRKKISIAKRGNTCALGHRLSEETKLKLSASKKGKHFGLKTEYKKGNIPWCAGKHLSEAIKYKMSLAKRGKTSPRKGVKLSEETRKKLSDSHKGKKTWKYEKSCSIVS